MLLASNLIVQGIINNRVVAFSSVLTLCTCCYTTWSTFLRALLFFTPKLHEIVVRRLISSYIIIQMFPLCTMNGVKLVITGDELPERPERALFISNHQSWTDWLLIEMLAVRSNASGLVAYIVKNSIKYIPYYGLQLYLNGCVYIRRNRAQDEILIDRYSQWLHGKSYNYWIVLFPEGTRFNRDNLEMVEKSQAVATQKGYRPFNNVLFPKPGGFQILTKSLVDYFDAIYDVTIAYPNGDKIMPNFMRFSRGYIPVVHMHINRIPFREVVNTREDFEQANTWLCNTFQDKDDRLEQFYRTGELASTPSQEFRLSYKRSFPDLCFYLSFCLPMLLTARGREIWLKLSLAHIIGGTLIAGIFL